MATYTVGQLKQAAYNAGFRGTALTVAVAVSLAENSSRNPAAVSPVNHDGSRDHGAFQINDKAHADLLRTGNVNDLQANAKMAYRIYQDNGSNFRPWTTFNSGSYKSHLTTAQSAKASGGSWLGNLLDAENNLIPGSKIPTPGNVLGDITGLPGNVAGTVSDAAGLTGLNAIGEVATHLLDGALWKRAGLFVGGFVLILIGVIIMIESNKTVKNATVSAAKAAAVA